MLPIDDNGDPDLSELDAIAGRPRSRSSRRTSSRTRSAPSTDLAPLVTWAHEQGAIFVCDAAQAAPHMKVDVQALGADFVAISGHKMCGPSGIGALWGRGELLARWSRSSSAAT